MSTFGIQGQLLEITVAGCNKLKNTEWITRQDPYVCIEYGGAKFRTRTCKDGGRNPTFQEKFVLPLIEGLREFNVVVWNRNHLSYDDFIGSGKIQLQKVLSNGYDDSAWDLQDKKGRNAGEVRLILHYANASKPVTSHFPPAPPCSLMPAPQVPLYSAPPAPSYPPTGVPAPASYEVPLYLTPPVPSYPPIGIPAPAPYPSKPPNPAVCPPPSYHQQPTYPPTYPPGPAPPVYPPHSVYPPPPNNPQYYPPVMYPPPSPYHPPQY